MLMKNNLDFPVLYASGRSGWASKDIGPRENLKPLLNTILDHVKPDNLDKTKSLRYLYISLRR